MKQAVAVESNNLKKVLGVAFGIAVVVGSTIGVGILRAPGSIAALLPNATLIILCWIAIGLYIILSASSFAELTTMLPKAGGAYNYIKRAFGNYAGLMTGWFDFISNAMAPAYFCIVLSEYCILIFPELRGSHTIIAILFLTLFAVINLPGVRSGSFTQKVTSAAKLVLFFVLIIGCFVSRPQAYPESLVSDAALSGGIMIGLFKSLQLIIGSYDGSMSVSFFAEEDTDPGRNVPRSYLIGALMVCITYVLINAAILYVLPVSVVARSPLAASEAASVAFGSWGSTLMTAVAIFSLLSILNAYMMIPSRILFGLSRDNYFMRQGMIVNKGGTPYIALLVCYLFAAILIIYSSFEAMFALGAFMMTIVMGFSFASLIRMRKTEPDLPRPYRAYGYPFTTWLALVVTVALFIGFAVSDPASLSIIAAIVVISYIAHRIVRAQKNNDPNA
jgi:APA family basic amino acid/polyamine antiporter